MDWQQEAGLRWRPLAPFGVELDADLSAPLSSQAAARLKALFLDFGLIVAHDQALSLEQQQSLLAPFGPILERIGESGYITTEHAHGSARAPLTFHSDAAYTPDPFEALSLHALDVVDGASSTRFAGAERGCATLPSALRAQLDAHPAEMVCPSHEALGLRACDASDMAIQARAEQPGIIVNPRTGRACIGVSEMHTMRLTGMDEDESRAALTVVFDHLYGPDNVTDHVWRKGDLVIWDNVTFQHARGPLDGAGRRVLQRVVVGIEKESVPERMAAAR